MFNLSVVPANMKPEASAERFVRVRNPEVLARMLAAPGVDKLSGFVLLFLAYIGSRFVLEVVLGRS